MRRLLKPERKSDGAYELLLTQLNFLKFIAIRQETPDRLPRCRNGRRQRRIPVLQKREHLEQQEVIALPQVGKRWVGLSTVERTECTEQVVDLILQRQLREQANGMGVFEPLLQARQIESRRCRRSRDRRGNRCPRPGGRRPARVGRQGP